MSGLKVGGSVNKMGVKPRGGKPTASGALGRPCSDLAPAETEYIALLSAELPPPRENFSRSSLTFVFFENCSVSSQGRSALLMMCQGCERPP